jgi:hypothetical protein
MSARSRFLKWEVEDTFFGAILGAFLGTFIQQVPSAHVALLVLFFVVFPLVLRKAERISPKAVIFSCVAAIAWIVGFAFDLMQQGIFHDAEAFTVAVIFSGWMLTAIAKAVR